MKKKTKSRLLDVFIVALCVAVSTSFLFLFWKDLNHSSVRKDKDSIATIAYKYKIAQRKFNDRVVWERLQQNAPLYNADMIRTAEQSMATITFNDGTVVDVNSSTMLQIFYDESGYSLSIEGGDIDIDTTTVESKKNIAVKLDDGSVLKLENGSKLSASSNVQSGVKNVSLKSGNVSVETDSGGKEKLVAGDSIRLEKQEIQDEEQKNSRIDKIKDIIARKEVSQTAAPSSEPVTVTVIKREPVTVVSVPKELKVLLFDGKNVKVEIAWKKSSLYADVPVKLDLSFDKNFSTIYKHEEYSVGTSAMVETVSEKTVYWRVYVDNETENASSGKIYSEIVPPVKLLSPVTKSSFSYIAENPKITFAWTGNDLAAFYKLEVADSPDMKNSVYAEEIHASKVDVSCITEGKYYWRVIPYYAENNIGYAYPTQVASFTVSKIEKILPPSLLIPADMAELSTGRSVSFGWKSDAVKSEYELMISRSKDFTDSVVIKKTEKKRISCMFDAGEIPEGEYFWKISSVNEKGEKVSSEIRKFKIKKMVSGENRLVYPPEHFSVEKEKLPAVDFMWKFADEYKAADTKSVLIISSRPDFSSDVIEIESQRNSVAEVKLKEGKYFWKVAVIDESLDVKPNYTETRSFVVLNELMSPKILYPAAGQLISVYGENDVSFRWKKVPDADYYNVKIYKADDNKLISETVVKGTEFKAEIPVPKTAENRTRYIFTVQAVCSETEYSGLRVSKVSENSFYLRLSQPVLLVSPADNTVIDGLAALRYPVMLSWKPGDKVEKARFILKKLQSDGTYKTVQTTENPDQVLKFSRLESGSYLWTVEANSPDGIPLDAEKYYSFVIKSVPALNKAVLISPAEKKVFTAEYFRNSRYIDFSWNPVSGATDYEFALYKKMANGSLQKIDGRKNIRKNEFRFKNLKSLDIGSFEWQVMAYSHASDGFEERRSSVSEGNFEIKFSLPEKVKTIDAGKMYGD